MHVNVSAGRELSQDEILALMMTCRKDKNKKAGMRDAAIIALMHAAGLRRPEVVNLPLRAFDKKSGQLTVIGKYRRTRTIYLARGVARATAAWLKIRGT